MAPAALLTRLTQEADTNIEHAVDQAICASKNVPLDSEAYRVLTSFCADNAAALSLQNPHRGLEAAIIGMDSLAENDQALKAACDHIIGTYKRMAVFNPDKTKDAVCSQLSMLNGAHPLRGALTSYLLETLDESDYPMFKRIAGHADALPAKDRLSFIDRIAMVVDTAPSMPSGVPPLLEKFLLNSMDARINDEAYRKAAEIFYDGADTPSFTVIKGDQSASAHQKATYKADGNVLILQPRRNP